MIDQTSVKKTTNKIVKGFTDYLTDDEVELLRASMSKEFTGLIYRDLVEQKRVLEDRLAALRNQIQDMDSILNTKNVEDNAPLEIDTYAGFHEWRNGIRQQLQSTMSEYRGLKPWINDLNARIEVLKNEISQA